MEDLLSKAGKEEDAEFLREWARKGPIQAAPWNSSTWGLTARRGPMVEIK